MLKIPEQSNVLENLYQLLFEACLSRMQLFRFLFKIAGKPTNMAPNMNVAGTLNSWEGECKIASTQIPNLCEIRVLRRKSRA